MLSQVLQALLRGLRQSHQLSPTGRAHHRTATTHAIHSTKKKEGRGETKHALRAHAHARAAYKSGQQPRSRAWGWRGSARVKRIARRITLKFTMRERRTPPTRNAKTH